MKKLLNENVFSNADAFNVWNIEWDRILMFSCDETQSELRNFTEKSHNRCRYIINFKDPLLPINTEVIRPISRK